MGGLTGGGSSKGSQGPFEFGPSAFDLQAIQSAVGQNIQAIQNRYQQLGLGGSTMEGQDVTGAQNMGTAMTGQEQTANVGNAALNPALQPQLNDLIGATANQGVGLGSLAKAAGGLASL
ncbi:MAG TPA: hypothetical protein VHT52_04145 [Stellaceae bacterium]|nr:hypothetical protein [Stellaceae bacterium]